ncbi:MAG: trehalose-phosphatase [Alphaproteobacteria bacterium]|nr:trehalose-phosphatase [Alphaproteobacteria bacterium]MBU1516645.1 trehalose-phosphatase [Alphaproteobacteria bacterium]MBU2094401.1 trehalose-phosphatase [Alphaproteobacteria bacterium]MBU2153286.1 trehalose-phosphatase [Alphaproteobacteria bacterium]MBU2307572.1 trehalose-phosphatase [Alphaproteobacteria bacterium]
MTLRSRPPATTLALSEIALFLDLDGTLTPLCASPDQVRPEPELTDLLRRAAAGLAGRVAVISGRTVASVDAIVECACTAVAGVHGLQRRTAAGVLEAVSPHPRVQSAADQMAAFARACPGLLVEHKEQSAALHYRGAPQAEPAVLEFVQRLAEAEALALQPGHMVMELRTPGPDKGAAVRAFLAEAPFRGRRPVYVGDDHTDESAFVAAVDAGGFGVLVGPERLSAAGWRLDDPSAVRSWIAAALDRGAVSLGDFARWAA